MGRKTRNRNKAKKAAASTANEDWRTAARVAESVRISGGVCVVLWSLTRSAKQGASPPAPPRPAVPLTPVYSTGGGYCRGPRGLFRPQHCPCARSRGAVRAHVRGDSHAPHGASGSPADGLRRWPAFCADKLWRETTQGCSVGAVCPCARFEEARGRGGPVGLRGARCGPGRCTPVCPARRLVRPAGGS